MINFKNYELGVTEYENQNYTICIDYFTKSILDNNSLGNSFSIAYFFRGMSYFYLENYNKAIKDFEEASIAMFDDYRVYYFKGVSHFNLSQYDEAILDLNKTLELNNEFEDSYMKLYEIYRIICSDKLAQEMLTKMITLNPVNVEVVNKLSKKYTSERFGNLSKTFQIDFFSLFPNDPKAVELLKEISSTIPNFSGGGAGNSLYLSYILMKNRKKNEETSMIIQEKNDSQNKENNKIFTVEEKKMSKENTVSLVKKLRNKVKRNIELLNSLGKDESLESIIKSVLVSVLIGLMICLFIGWMTSTDRVFYDIGEYSEGQRTARIESYFNYGAGIMFGSISTLFIFIRSLSSSINSKPNTNATNG